jgi:hypothetical protein
MTEGWLILFTILGGLCGGGAALQLPGVADRKTFMLIAFAFASILTGVVTHKALSTVVHLNKWQAEQLSEAQRMAEQGS